MKIPRPRPPTSASGRLVRRPTAAAAIATTTRLKKSCATNVLKVGAMRTPAIPAKRLESAQLNADTRSAWMPLSSVIRGDSTTARMRSPTGVNLKTRPRTTIPATATAIATSSFRLNA